MTINQHLCGVLALLATTLLHAQPAAETPATQGMIAGTTGAAALEGGLDILKRGGTAMDAALSTSLSQVALAAGSWVSYAGLLNLVYYEAQTGKVYNLNASFNTVKDETDPLSITGGINLDFSQKGTETDGRAVLVPGYMAGVDEAHRRFGALPFASIFEQAIAIAEQGLVWNEGLQHQFRYREDVLMKQPNARSVFTKADGSQYQPGDLFRQPALAATLRQVAAQRSAYMYTGDWAAEMVALVQQAGGLITLDDLASYRAIWTEPLKGTYNGYDVYVHGFPAYGGLTTLEALNLLEVARMHQRPVYTENAAELKELSDIIRIGDIAMYLEPFLGNIPGLDFSNEGRLKKENAYVLYELLKMGYFAGAAPPQADSPKHSDAIVAVDRWGNMCALTHSINAVSWGGTGLFVGGVSIPDPASFQQAQVAAAGPGNRLPDPTNPGIVLRDGQPVLGFASIGAGLHAQTVSCLLAVLGYGTTPQQAVDMSALGGLNFPADGAMPRTVTGEAIGEVVLDDARELGGQLVRDASKPGYWVGILRNDQNQLSGAGAAALQLGGRAVGY